MAQQCLVLESIWFIGARCGYISVFGLLHELIGDEWPLTRQELAFAVMPVGSGRSEIVSPVGVRFVMTGAQLLLLFLNDDRVKVACLRWHVLPQHDVFLKLSVSRLVIQLAFASSSIFEASSDVLLH